MERRQLITMAVVLVGGLGVVRPAAASVRLSVAGVAAAPLACVPLWLAQRLGFFEAEGVEVSLGAGPAADALAAQAAPAVPVYATPFDAVVQAHVAARPLQVFAALTRTPQLGLGWHVDGPSPAARQRWRGAVVGVLEHDRTARLALAHLWRPLGGAQRAGAILALHATPEGLARDFLARRIDAVCVADPWLTRLQRTGVLQLELDTRNPEHSQRLFGGPVLGACLSAAPAVLASHAAELRALARAVQRSLRWLQTASPLDLAGHTDVLDLGEDRALFLAVLMHARASFVSDVTPDPVAVHNTLRWLLPHVAGTAADRADAARWFTTRLAPTD